MKFHLLCLLALFALLQVTSGACKDEFQKIKLQLEAMSHYEGTPEEPDMGDMPMDDPDRRRDADPQTPSNCFLYNATSSTVDVNCDSHQCITLILDLVDTYDDLMEEVCVQPFNPDQEEQATMALIALLRPLTTCNQCIVHYTKFTKLENQLKKDSCLPSSTHYRCENDCLSRLETYSTLWRKMIEEGICREYNPGGCGDMGGVTEGDIYVTLNEMSSEIARIETVLSICSPGCKEPMVAWYQEWKPLVAKKCISSPETNFTGNTTFLEDFTLDLQCVEECQTEVKELIKKFYASHSVLSGCSKGLISAQISQLSNSINADKCEDAVSGSSPNLTVIANSFFTLCLLSVGVFFIYFFSSMAYNRFVKGKKGWETVPTIWCCRSKASSSTKPKKVRGSRDEEEVVLYDADDFDDEL